jgi:hypothetical protein
MTNAAAEETISVRNNRHARLKRTPISGGKSTADPNRKGQFVCTKGGLVLPRSWRMMDDSMVPLQLSLAKGERRGPKALSAWPPTALSKGLALAAITAIFLRHLKDTSLTAVCKGVSEEENRFGRSMVRSLTPSSPRNPVTAALAGRRVAYRPMVHDWPDGSRRFLGLAGPGYCGQAP